MRFLVVIVMSTLMTQKVVLLHIKEKNGIDYFTKRFL